MGRPQGNNYHLDIYTIDLGQIYADFSESMQIIEQNFVDILYKSNPAYLVNIVVTMEYYDLVNRYSFKHITLIE
jgi:hypothetical protein